MGYLGKAAITCQSSYSRRMIPNTLAKQVGHPVYIPIRMVATGLALVQWPRNGLSTQPAKWPIIAREAVVPVAEEIGGNNQSGIRRGLGMTAQSDKWLWRVGPVLLATSSMVDSWWFPPSPSVYFRWCYCRKRQYCCCRGVFSLPPLDPWELLSPLIAVDSLLPQRSEGGNQYQIIYI